MLTDAELIPYLLEQGLISSEQLVTDAWRIEHTNYRNQNRNVTNSQSLGVFIKSGDSSSGIGTLRNEATIYQMLSTCGETTFANRWLPPFLGYDANCNLLHLGSIPHAVDLESYHQQRGRFPIRFAKSMGVALADLHRVTPHASHGNDLYTTRPVVFEFDHPPIELLSSISAASLELFKLIQRYDLFGMAFHDMSNQWRPDTLIHGDLRLANFVTSNVSAGRKRIIKLVDWEFCGFGDPRWDLGAVFASYLKLWLDSVPVTNAECPDQHIGAARFSLHQVQKSVTTFWQAYRDRVRSHSIDPLPDPADIASFAAANLLNTVYSMTQNQATLTTQILMFVQVCHNVLQNPTLAVHDLFGIETATSEAT